MALEIKDIVRVTDRLQPAGALRRTLGITLLVTTDDTVLAGAGSDRLRSYGNLDAVIADFGAAGTVVDSASRYFGQRIFPRNFMVGRWRNTSVPSVINGGAPGTVTAIEAVTDASFSLAGEDFEGLDFDMVGDYDAVASKLQAELRTGTAELFANAAVTYSATNQRLEISFPNHPDVSGLFGAHSDGTGTDVSSLLGLTADDGATYKQGGAQETIAECLTALNQLNDSFYFGILETVFNGTQTMLDANAWFASQRKEFIAESNEAEVVNTNDNATFGARLSALQAPRTLLIWSKTADQKAASVAGFLSSIDFTQPRGIKTLKFKALPGTTPDNLTPTQKAELDRKRINHYSPYGGINMVAEGWLGSGDFVEVRYWLDWFVEAIQVAVFNHLYSSGSTPMTRAGLQTIRNVIAGVCRQGLLNGGLSPGQVNEAMAGEIRDVTNRAFDGNLNNGYLIYVPMIEQTNRQSRRTPSIRVWGRGGSAVHFANISIDFQGA